MANPQCKATAKQRGERCRLSVVPGATVCYIHGGRAPQVQAKAAARLALAEALANGDHRPAALILRDALTAADVLLTDAKIAIVKGGEPIAPERIDQLVASIGRAAALAKTALDVDVDEKLRKLADGDVALLDKIMMETWTRWPEFDYHNAGAFKRLLAQVIRWLGADGPLPEPVVLAPSAPARKAIAPAVRPSAGAASPAAPGDPPSTQGRQRPVQRPDEATVIEAEIVDPLEEAALVRGREPLALSRYERCPGCAQPIVDQAEHDRVCGWNVVRHRGGMGW